jgi:hypothetical protein
VDGIRKRYGGGAISFGEAVGQVVHGEET